MVRHFPDSAILDFGHGFVNREIRRVRFGGAGDVDDCLRERNPSLRQPDEFHGGQGGVSHQDRPGIGVSHIFRGGNDEPPGDKARIIARSKHARHPIERGIRIAAAQGFDERRGDVVMLVAFLIIDERAFLHAFLGHGQGHRDVAIGLRRRCECGEFQGVQEAPRVAVGLMDEMRSRFGVEPQAFIAQAAFLILQGVLQTFDKASSDKGLNSKTCAREVKAELT